MYQPNQPQGYYTNQQQPPPNYGAGYEQNPYNPNQQNPYYSQPQYYNSQPVIEQPVAEQPYYEQSPSVNKNPEEVLPDDDQDFEKFVSPPKYQDVLFLFIWMITFVATFVLLVLGVYMRVTGKWAEENDKPVLPDDVNGDTLWHLMVVAVICSVSATVMAITWLLLCQNFARQLITISFILSIALNFATGIVMILLGSFIFGGLMLILAILYCFCWCFWRSRIPFATEMLTLIATILQQYPGTIRMAFIGLGLQILWVIGWSFAIILIQQFSENVAYGLSLFLLFSFYWTSEVIKNVVHVTIGGTTATWYFLGGTTNSIPENPTLQSFKRASTTSIGSICLGSMIVAILRFLRALFTIFRGNHGSNDTVTAILACLAECVLMLIERLAEYFNMYAFAQVAIYGKSYIRAAKDTWALIHSHGIQAIVNDDLIGNVLGIATLSSALVTAVIGAVLGLLFLEDLWIFCAIMGFLIGLVLVGLVMEVIASAVVTIFVCFAEDPNALKTNHPDVYASFSQTYGNVCDQFNA